VHPVRVCVCVVRMFLSTRVCMRVRACLCMCSMCVHERACVMCMYGYVCVCIYTLTGRAQKRVFEHACAFVRMYTHLKGESKAILRTFSGMLPVSTARADPIILRI
jgi:hypothetical protein